MNAPPAVDNAPHRPPDDKEEVYYEGTPLIRGRLAHVAGFTLLGLIFIVAPVLAGTYFPKWPWPWWVRIALVLIGIAFVAMPAFLVKQKRYRITNYRIDFERGWLSTSIDTIELWHVEDIKFHQSLWDKIVGAGNIEVFSHDNKTPKLFLDDLPHARQLFTTLEQRIISVKRQSGVLKLDSGS
jgi:MFS family permease